MNEVYTNAGVFVGIVEKDATGNWVARHRNGHKLSELRPVMDGYREFNYFATKKAAAAALRTCRQ